MTEIYANSMLMSSMRNVICDPNPRFAMLLLAALPMDYNHAHVVNRVVFKTEINSKQTCLNRFIQENFNFIALDKIFA